MEKISLVFIFITVFWVDIECNPSLKCAMTEVRSATVSFFCWCLHCSYIPKVSANMEPVTTDIISNQ